METSENKVSGMVGQPWLVGMYQNRLNPRECKISLRTLLSKKEVMALVDQASAATPPEEGKEGEYHPVQYCTEVMLPLGPGMALPLEISVEVYDEDRIKLNQNLYGYARSQVESHKESKIIQP